MITDIEKRPAGSGWIVSGVFDGVRWSIFACLRFTAEGLKVQTQGMATCRGYWASEALNNAIKAAAVRLLSVN